MKKRATLITIIACMLSLFMAFAFVACGNNDGDGSDAATVTKIELLSTAEVAVGDAKNVVVQITYSDGETKKSDNNLVWTSDKTDVATVTRGIVTGKAKGTAKVSASIGNVTSNVCEVSVYNLTLEIAATGLEEGATEAKLNKEEKLQLTTIAKKDGEVMDGVEVEWKSSDENVATVSATGEVTGWADGEATITATRKGATQKAEFKVTVEWVKPVGYKEMEFAEQNKLHPGAWGFWSAREANWGAGAATEYDQYTSEFIENDDNLKDGYEYIGMGKATFEFSIETFGGVHGYQVFFRSSDNFTDDEGVQGKLKYNHDYAISFKVKSNVEGTIYVNPRDDKIDKAADQSVEDYNAYLVAQETAGKIQLAKKDGEYVTDGNGIYVTDHTFDLVANQDTEINTVFRHDDCGYIYKGGIYDNMGTALYLQLAHLGWNKDTDETRGHVIFTVYDVQFKDLGEATNPVACDPTKHEGYEPPPPEGELGETVEAVYTATNEGGNTLAEKDTWGVWYAADAAWDCGNAITMVKTLSEEDKTLTLKFNPNGNTNDWGVQLRYSPATLKAGANYKVKVKINTTVAYSISLNGKTYNLEVGDNIIEFYWQAGTYMLEGNISKAGGEEEITLVISDFTWNEIIPTDAGGETDAE